MRGAQQIIQSRALTSAPKRRFSDGFLGRFLSGFMAGFWLLRIVLQIFYYDREIRRENRALDILYLASLVVLVVVFGTAAVRPVG